MSKEHLKGRCNRCCADITVTLTDELIDNVRASMLDEVIEAIDWVNDNYDYDWSPSFMLEKIICRLEEKYNVQR